MWTDNKVNLIELESTRAGNLGKASKKISVCGWKKNMFLQIIGAFFADYSLLNFLNATFSTARPQKYQLLIDYLLFLILRILILLDSEM